MHTLSHVARACAARRNTPLLLSALACLLAPGCQTSRNLDSTPYDRQFDADGYLFESDRRYIVLQFTESRMDGVVDDDWYVAYMSVPIDREKGLEFKDPGIAVGYSSVAFLFSDMFNEKNGDVGELLPRHLRKHRGIDLTTDQLLELSIERSTVYDPAKLREVDPGRELQILDYASLIQPDEIASDTPNPQNRESD